MNSIAWFNFLSWTVVSCSLKGLSAVTSFSDAFHPPLWGKNRRLKTEMSALFSQHHFTNTLVSNSILCPYAGGSPSFSSNSSHASLTGPAAKAVASAISQWVPWFSSWLKIFYDQIRSKVLGCYCKPFIEVLGISCACCLYYLKLLKKEGCNLVRAFWEMKPFLAKNANIPSGDYICLASRLFETGHENRLSSDLPKLGYQQTSITYCGNSTPPSSSCFGCAGLQLTRKTRLMLYWWGMRTHSMKTFGWSRGSNGIASSSIDGAGDPEKEKLTKWLQGWIFWGTASKRECCFQFCSAAWALVKS